MNALHRIPLLLSFLAACASPPSGKEAAPSTALLLPPDAPPLVRLAGAEIRRYVYLRTGVLLPVSTRPLSAPSTIRLTLDSALAPEEYALRTEGSQGSRVLRIRGGSPRAVLYGAYAFAERLGIRFGLERDIIPSGRIPFSLPLLDEVHRPLFRIRGILPFHDFPEGPDWWSAGDYRTVLAQLARLRMNFIAFHCYPEGGVGPEPLVWIGLPEDIGPGAEVKAAYPAKWASTAAGTWGYAPAKTSDFAAGASLLFPKEDFGQPLLEGVPLKPRTQEECRSLFAEAGRKLGRVFRFARALGVQVCLGTETPLTIPKALQERLRARSLDPRAPATVRRLYEGVFRRLAQVSPVDWYWLWTKESWTWAGTKKEEVDRVVRDLRLALEGLDRAGRPFGFATCGWVLGPPGDRILFDRILPGDAALSCINRNVGFQFVEPAFSLVRDREKWAIPWMEDDPALTIPQLWVGRLRRDAADALARGCTGLLGIHWRTRILDPNVSALAEAAWDQSAWNPDFGKPLPPPRRRTLDVHCGGRSASSPSNSIAGTDLDPIYRTCRWNLEAYVLKVPPGRHTVTLRFCEIHYDKPGKRVFGVEIQGKRVVKRLDVFARAGKNRALNLTFPDVPVGRDGRLEIRFVKIVEYPFIAGLEVEGRTPEGRPFHGKIDCGGPAWKDWEADLPALGSEILPSRTRDLPCLDFYRRWARAEFGPGAAETLARFFRDLDGGPGDYSRTRKPTRLPRPADWVGGPGGIRPDPRPWEKVKKRYAFVDRMASLRRFVRGKENLARFDSWLQVFRYLRCMGRIACRRGALDRAVKEMTRTQDPAARKEIARRKALPLRIALARDWEDLLTLALSWVSTPGGMGTIANLELHVRRNNRAPHFLSLHDEKLEKALGAPLPPSVRPGTRYRGAPRLFVPTHPNLTGPEESLPLRAVLLDQALPKEVRLHWRPLGRGLFRSRAMDHLGRGVYQATLPAPGPEGLEYYVSARLASGRTLFWPPAAPERNQTLLEIPGSWK